MCENRRKMIYLHNLYYMYETYASITKCNHCKNLNGTKAYLCITCFIFHVNVATATNCVTAIFGNFGHTITKQVKNRIVWRKKYFSTSDLDRSVSKRHILKDILALKILILFNSISINKTVHSFKPSKQDKRL